MTADAGIIEAKVDQLLADHPPSDTKPADFLGAQYDAGLAWVQFPEGFGGLGASPSLQRTIDERLVLECCHACDLT